MLQLVSALQAGSCFYGGGKDLNGLLSTATAFIVKFLDSSSAETSF